MLIIDDSRAQATHTERVLNNAGIVTQTLTEPIRAIGALAEFQPDLIILDMYMPDCRGTELAKVIRQHERYVSVPIIYLSAEDDLTSSWTPWAKAATTFSPADQAEPPDRHGAPRAPRAQPEGAHRARQPHRSVHTHSLQLLEDARFRASSRQSTAELRHARHRSLQAGQRHLRPPHG